MGFTSKLLVSFLVVGALLPVPTVTQSNVKPRPVAPRAPNRCMDRHVRDAGRSERAVARCVGPSCGPCDGICKSRCGVGEMASTGLCFSGCRCCKRAIITIPCLSGYCGNGGKCSGGTTCPKGHKSIPGFCGSSSGCTCCAPPAIPCLSGYCGNGGKCIGGTTCPKGYKSIPGLCSSSSGCTCCAPSDCFYQGKMYENGATWTDKCNIHKCSSGSVTTSLRSDCCSFGRSSYLPGAKIKNSCAQLMCDNGKFQYKGIDDECPRCVAYLDPHIVTYDQHHIVTYDQQWGDSYSYQGCGNYSLSQIGSTYQPTAAIYATFATCGGYHYLTCVETVTIKNDEHTFITIRFESNELKVEINGNNYAISSSSPSIVMNAAYPVLVWKSSANCVILQGSSGFLVQFCGSSSWANHVYVWASPAITKSLKGLCGTVNNDLNDDFTTRGGIITSHWQTTPSVAFPKSWLTSSTSNGQCVGRSKREAQNTCDSNSSSLNKYKSQCRTTIMNGFSGAQSEELNAMIEDCVFDLCHVNDPDDWIKAVQETAKVHAVIKAHTLVPGCQGRCTAGGGSGYCKDTCSLGEELLGSCPGGNCFCCRQQNYKITA